MIDIPESTVLQYIHTGESKFREVIMTLNLGTKIRDLRKRDSRTQEDLASALGVSAQAVSRWDNDNTFPDMTLFWKKTSGSVWRTTAWTFIWTNVCKC